MKGMSSMRTIRSLATALLVAGLAVAGCGRSQSDQTAAPTSGPPAVTATPTPKAPAPTPVPVRRPRILSVTTTPTLLRDGGFLVLPAGAGTITFHVRAINAQRVRFSLGPTGTGVRDLAKPLGEDSNGRDGWTLTWRYKQDEPTPAFLYVNAIGPGGTSPEVLLGLYHAEPAPRIVSVTTSPPLPSRDGWLQLSGAGTVTFHAQVLNAQRVRFYLSPTGTNGFALAKLLGEDTNGRDGWTATWHYQDEPLLAHLTVKATGPGGTSPDTLLSLYHPGPA
jgi:hypothetical protein